MTVGLRGARAAACLSLSAGLLFNASASAQSSSLQAWMPPEVKIQLTLEGPIFVDARGMTLYQPTPDVESCDNRPKTLVQSSGVFYFDGAVDFDVAVPDVATRRSCIQKRLPLLASQAAQPVGKWGIEARTDGTRQWTYDGGALYRSIKDRVPGEINGSGITRGGLQYPWKVAEAPLSGVPPGIGVKRTAIGLALVNAAGQTLYYPDEHLEAADSALWRAVTGAELATSVHLPGWSLMNRRDGRRQWAYQGRPLYTYARDAPAGEAAKRRVADIFGGTYGERVHRLHVALLVPAPDHPRDLTIQSVIEEYGEFARSSITQKIYADAKGMSVYAFTCVERTADKLDCDDSGDSERYWLLFCGGEELCMRTWRPVIAAVGATSIDTTWSVVSINPRHPWRAVAKGAQGLSVWAYKGRPVFTYAGDSKPGDMHGRTPSNLQFHAGVLTAYESSPHG